MEGASQDRQPDDHEDKFHTSTHNLQPQEPFTWCLPLWFFAELRRFVPQSRASGKSRCFGDSHGFYSCSHQYP
jgi:hypothetical protein